MTSKERLASSSLNKKESWKGDSFLLYEKQLAFEKQQRKKSVIEKGVRRDRSRR